MTDWVAEMFPGDGLQHPDDDERDRADAVITQWNERWNESRPPIPRIHPEGAVGIGGSIAGLPTNRAYLRSKLRRWWNAGLPTNRAYPRLRRWWNGPDS